MTIEYTTDGAVGIITLSRPEKKNAMLLAMRDGLAELCERINDSPEVRAVVLTGAGTDFCAGADIGEMGMGGLNGSFLRARHMHKVVPDDALMDEALALAREYAGAPTIALGLAKRMFDVAPSLTLDEFMDLEGSMLPLAVQADDFKEGTQAFKDKRPARFTGH